MIPKKSLDSVLDQSIILTKTAPNDNAKSISVQCEGVQMVPVVFWMFLSIFMIFYNLFGRSVGAGGARGARGAGGLLYVLKYFL